MYPYRSKGVYPFAMALLFVVTNLAHSQDIQVFKSDVTVLPSLAQGIQHASNISNDNRSLIPYEVPNPVFKVHGFGESMRTSEGVNLNGDPLWLEAQRIKGNDQRGRSNQLMQTTVMSSVDGASSDDNATQFGFRISPPDTDGDVGFDHYVQMVNSLTTIFNKNTQAIVSGPFPNNAFWAGTGNVCETTNRGDPIVLFDEEAGRWFVSQFAFDVVAGVATAPFFQCVAVSQTSDPTGAYNTCTFDFGNDFNDYPKHGIVTNSITMMANIFDIPAGGTFSGSFLGAIDKQAIYDGTGCTLVGNTQAFPARPFGFVAADLDDETGTAGTVPALFAAMDFFLGVENNMQIWQVTPDFVTPANTVIANVADIPVTAFDREFCAAAREACIEVPNPGLDMQILSTRLMHRLQVRDFGTHRSLLTTHDVDVDGTGRAGVRWYEFRETGGVFSLHQEGTYGPDDGKNRWISSIAMNSDGAIAIGYQYASAVDNPSVGLVGRTPAAALGVLDSPEALAVVGGGVQTGSSRAGDYAATKVDPGPGPAPLNGAAVAANEFWHTNMYVAAPGGNFIWHTNVSQFAIEQVSLPVALTNFEAQKLGNDVELIWTTGNELNNSGFEIEYRQINLENTFNLMGFVEGAGTSSESQEYRFVTEKLDPGLYAFRLKQIDFDGTANYSAEVQTLIDVPGTHFLSSAFPNPFNPQTNFSITIPVAQEVRIEIFDIEGRLVEVLHEGLLDANTPHRFYFDASGLPSGIYNYRATGIDFSEGRNVILMK